MSINIENFSIGLDEFKYCDNPIVFSVDITDSIYGITTSGTYFTENGFLVVDTLQPITDGYRLSYTTTPSGNMLLVANASNTNGDTLSASFDLLYGYNVLWEAVNYWGPSKEVPINVMASNTALASNTAYFSTFFRTKAFEVSDLEIGITAEGSGYSDLLCDIKPQSKYFLQGKTYTVTISGIKDFSGNVLSTKIFSFSVE